MPANKLLYVFRNFCVIVSYVFLTISFRNRIFCKNFLCLISMTTFQNEALVCLDFVVTFSNSNLANFPCFLRFSYDFFQNRTFFRKTSVRRITSCVRLTKNLSQSGRRPASCSLDNSITLLT